MRKLLDNVNSRCPKCDRALKWVVLEDPTQNIFLVKTSCVKRCGYSEVFSEHTSEILEDILGI